MPSSVVRTFSDPDAYAESIRGTKAEITVIGRGQFAAKLVSIDLHRLRMQRVSDNLPRVVHSAAMAERASVSFLIRSGPSLLTGGAELQPANIRRVNESQNVFQRSSGSARLALMSLPVDEMVSLGAAVVGVDLAPPRDALTLIPQPAAMERLRRLHAAAGRLAEDTPEIIANPDAARGLEQALIEAMVDCLGTSEAGEDSVAQQ
jgi:hypothetical protein